MDQKDLEQIAELIDLKLSMRFGEFSDKINNDLTKWKSEIFDLVDDLAEEIRDGREHREITSYQITGHRERIEKLEKKVFGAVTAGI